MHRLQSLLRHRCGDPFISVVRWDRHPSFRRCPHRSLSAGASHQFARHIPFLRPGGIFHRGAAGIQKRHHLRGGAVCEDHPDRLHSYAVCPCGDRIRLPCRGRRWCGGRRRISAPVLAFVCTGQPAMQKGQIPCPPTGFPAGVPHRLSRGGGSLCPAGTCQRGASGYPLGIPQKRRLLHRGIGILRNAARHGLSTGLFSLVGAQRRLGTACAGIRRIPRPRGSGKDPLHGRVGDAVVPPFFHRRIGDLYQLRLRDRQRAVPGHGCRRPARTDRTADPRDVSGRNRGQYAEGAG